MSFYSISRYSTPHIPRAPTSNNTSSSVPIIARPQGIRCICDYTDYDGFTVMCEKCFRYCHAACFDIEKRGDVPADWRCWVCLPRQASIDKGRAVRLQEARRSRLEYESREKSLNRIELQNIPEFKICASLVRKIFDIVATDTIRLHDAERKTLARSCLSLLLASENSSTNISPPVEQLQQIHDQLETWGSWSIVKSRIKQKETLATLTELQLKVAETLASIILSNGDGNVSNPELVGFFNEDKSMGRDGGPITLSTESANEPAVQVTPAVEDLSVSVHPDVPQLISQHSHRLYEHLISLLSNPISAVTMEQTVALRSAFHQIISLPLNIALARSQKYRIQLLQLSSDMRMSDRPELREALEKDEEYIFGSLSQIIILNEERSAVLRFDEDDAQCFLDLIQTKNQKALDKRQFDDENTIRIARRFLIKLSEVSNALPSSLIIHGVELKERDALFGGGFADIYRASYRGKDVAIKRMRVFQRGQDLRKLNRDFCREALIWQRLNHPHVLPFLGVDAETFSPYLCMISPWMQHGTIMRHLSENGNVNVVKRLYEVAQGLEYLHSENVVHGDLRGGNILIDDQWQACLADFGLTIASEATALTFTSHTHGSTRWMAPELYDPEFFDFAHARRTPASDVYSFACVCLEVFTGRAPFHNISSDPAVILQVMKNKRPQRPPKDAQRPISDDFWKLVCKCWAHQPSERLLVTEIVKTMKLWQKT